MSVSIKMIISEVRRIKSWRRIMYTYCKMAYPGKRVEELDNRPQTQQHVCVY
jgi:hypothetical protein